MLTDDDPLVSPPIVIPADRWLDRLLDRLPAELGLLDDGAPLLRDGECVPRAGVLLALLAIAQSGVVEHNVAPFLSNVNQIRNGASARGDGL